jgi:AAA+ superfamily predicted ATPase
MNGLQELAVTLKAGYAFFYISTQEVGRTVTLIRKWQEDNAPEVPMFFWDLEKDGDPAAVFEKMDSPDCPVGSVMVAKNWDWYLWDDFSKPNKTFCAMLLNRFEPWTTKEFRKTLIIVSDATFEKAIPGPLVREFLPLSFGMPDQEEIASILSSIIKSVESRPNFKKPNETTVKALVDAAKGMTSREVKNSFAYSLVKTGGSLDPILVATMRAKDVEKTAGLKISTYPGSTDDLKGYNNMFDFVLATMDSPLAKGVILLGPPGTGKTTFAKIIGKRSGRLVFEVEFAELFGSLVGETEDKWRRMLDVLKANAPCVVVWDEIEKGLSGGAGGALERDGGTAVRSAGQALKFLSDDRPPGIYIMATCNDIQSLAPEWVRPGRWDCAPFFIDLPSKEEQVLIWEWHMKKYGVKGKWQNLGTEGWSGAEIEACCRIASMMNTDVAKASSYVLPISKTMSEKISYLRNWAKDRTIPASAKFPGKASGKATRALDF